MKLRSIQMLRGIAATGVVIYHAWHNGPAVHAGAAGVDLFFVISGFIITRVASDRSAGEFLADRFLRVFPLWWVCALPFLIFGSDHSPATAITTITLWPIVGQITLPALQLGWTLSFECLFYCAMALALRTRAAVPLAMFALALALNGASGAPLFRYLGSPMGLEFLMGVGVALMPRVRPPFGLAFLGCGGLLLMIAPTGLLEIGTALSFWRGLERVLWWGPSFAMLVYGALSLERLATWRPLVLLGDASYSIYLTHAFVTYTIGGIHPLLTVAVSLTIGVLCHLSIEQWLADAGRRVKRYIKETRRRALLVSGSSAA